MTSLPHHRHLGIDSQDDLHVISVDDSPLQPHPDARLSLTSSPPRSFVRSLDPLRRQSGHSFHQRVPSLGLRSQGRDSVASFGQAALRDIEVPDHIDGNSDDDCVGGDGLDDLDGFEVSGVSANPSGNAASMPIAVPGANPNSRGGRSGHGGDGRRRRRRGRGSDPGAGTRGDGKPLSPRSRDGLLRRIFRRKKRKQRGGERESEGEKDHPPHGRGRARHQQQQPEEYNPADSRRGLTARGTRRRRKGSNDAIYIHGRPPVSNRAPLAIAASAPGRTGFLESLFGCSTDRDRFSVVPEGAEWEIEEEERMARQQQQQRGGGSGASEQQPQQRFSVTSTGTLSDSYSDFEGDDLLAGITRHIPDDGSGSERDSLLVKRLSHESVELGDVHDRKSFVEQASLADVRAIADAQIRLSAQPISASLPHVSRVPPPLPPRGGSSQRGAAGRPQTSAVMVNPIRGGSRTQSVRSPPPRVSPAAAAAPTIVQILLTTKGTKYTGEVDQQNRPHGRGRIEYSSGDFCSGTFVHGMREGDFMCRYKEDPPPDPTHPESEIQPSGSGGLFSSVSERAPRKRKRNNPCAVKHFMAYFESGQPSTSPDHLSNVVYQNGDKYVGLVRMEKIDDDHLERLLRHGRQGEMYWIRGTAMARKFAGEWKDDEMSGFGILEYAKYSDQHGDDIEEYYVPGDSKRRRKQGLETSVFAVARSSDANVAHYYGSFRAARRHGFGVMLYHDGTVFEGEWKNGDRNGPGKMKFPNGDMLEGIWRGSTLKNATFCKGTVKRAATCAALLMHESLFTLLKADESFQHLDHVSFPVSRQLSPSKWTVFFRNLADDARGEQKLLRRKSCFGFISAEKDSSLRRGSPEFDQMNFRSAMASIRRYLDESAENGFIKRTLDRFRDLFSFRYQEISVKDAKLLHPAAVDDVFSFLDAFIPTIREIMGPLADFFGNRLLSYLQECVLSKIHNRLFPIYTFRYQDDDNKFRFKLLSLAEISMEELGVSPDLIPAEGSVFTEPYERVMEIFRELPQQLSPFSKFQILIKAHNELLRTMEFASGMSQARVEDRGADDIFPVYLYCFIKTNVPNLYSEFRYMLDFSNRTVSSSEAGYRFTNFENALNYIVMLDSKVRDENDILITPSVLLQRIEKTIRDIKRQRRRLELEPVPVLWISTALVKIANLYHLEKGLVIPFDDFFVEAEEAFDVAVPIFRILGLDLKKISKESIQDMDVDGVSESAIRGEIRAERQGGKRKSLWTGLDRKVFKRAMSAEMRQQADHCYLMKFVHAYPAYVYHEVARSLDEM